MCWYKNWLYKQAFRYFCVVFCGGGMCLPGYVCSVTSVIMLTESCPSQCEVGGVGVWTLSTCSPAAAHFLRLRPAYRLQEGQCGRHNGPFAGREKACRLCCQSANRPMGQRHYGDRWTHKCPKRHKGDHETVNICGWAHVHRCLWPLTWALCVWDADVAPLHLTPGSSNPSPACSARPPIPEITQLRYLVHLVEKQCWFSRA